MTAASMDASTTTPNIIITDSGSPSSLSDFRDPFYASTIPQCYALAACTVISYMLVIMLLITPRTFLLEGAVVLGRRGFTNGPSGSDAGIGIGGRPWLQKVAALTVAISLSIATADTFKVAETQYDAGFMNAGLLQAQVEDGTELKVIRVVSDTFLWLAQAQTLIRLFPRQREKIIIKWTAFALIILDGVFTILNSFVFDSGLNRPHNFVDAIPALSYLFQLSLGLLYSAWVIYYSISKRQYAYYHAQMRNICLVAVLSLVSVLVPVVFFVLDISKPSLAAWGDYVRWVGAAAASVVVWEWVERIEALERNDKKDGVLGREVFDGDEMLEFAAASSGGKEKGQKSDGSQATGRSWPTVGGLGHRHKLRADHDLETGQVRDGGRRAPWLSRPPPAATPISRTDTASAESTVYAIRYHPISEATPPAVEPHGSGGRLRSNTSASEPGTVLQAVPATLAATEETPEAVDQSSSHSNAKPWQQNFTKMNPFHRRPRDPPPEVSAHTRKPSPQSHEHGVSNRWDVRARLEDFAATQAEKIRERTRPAEENVGPLPLTVIPAPIRNRRALREATGMDGAAVAPLFTSPDGHNTSEAPNSATPESSSRSIARRGSVAFASPLEGRHFEGDRTSPQPSNSRSNSVSARRPTPPRSKELPVFTIPAPTRRRREED